MYKQSILTESNLSFTSDGLPIYKKLSLSAGEKLLNTAIIFVHLATWIFLLTQLPKIPDEIPIKEEDNDSHRKTYVTQFILLLVPGIACLVLIILNILTWYPHLFILKDVRFTLIRAEEFYIMARCYVRLINLFVQILFLITCVMWVQKAREDQTPGLAVVLIPLVGSVLVSAVGTLFYNKSIREEIEAQDEEDERNQYYQD